MLRVPPAPSAFGCSRAHLAKARAAKPPVYRGSPTTAGLPVMSLNLFLSLTPWPAISAIIWIVVLVVVMYLARHTAHQAIRTATSAIGRGLRIASHSVSHGEARLAERNREVLLAAGREAKERIIEREFARVGETVRKDLANYPHLHRGLSEA